MKRITCMLHRTKSPQNSSDLNISNIPADSPEANASRAVRSFCESGGPSNPDEEVLHLPVIVEAAESSPAAAAASAQQIRRYLTKDYGNRPGVQYNAIMLIRILSDNPGPTFTRCFDQAFVKTLKECLRNSRDVGVQQLLRETLDSFEVNKGHDEGMQGLLAMWRKEKGNSASLTQQRGSVGSSRHGSGQRGVNMGSPPPLTHQHSSQRALSRSQLPPPYELASRVEEAKNTAKILLQLLQTTPSEEVLQNELLREFSERCQSAGQSMQAYINCDSPTPDHDTLQTLIETNEQLSLAQSRHQRAVLAARRIMGSSTSPNMETMHNGTGAFAGPPAPGQRESMAGLSAVQSHRSGDGWGGQQGSGMAWGTQRAQPEEYQSPQQRAGGNGWGGQNTFNNFQSPPGPPPGMMTTLQNREQPNPQYQQQYSPTAYNSYNPTQPDSPSTYNGFPSSNLWHSQPPQQNQQLAQSPPSNPFADPSDAAKTQRRTTLDLENAYSNPTSETQPATPPGPPPSHHQQTRNPFQQSQQPEPFSPVSAPSATSSVEPSEPANLSPQRPGPGPWHNSNITASFVGRQHSAINGMTMHGAASPPPSQQQPQGNSNRQSQGQSGFNNSVSASEVGGSGGGRHGMERIGPGTTYELDGASSEGRISEDLYGDGGNGGARNVQQRVDIGGTGGFRGMGGGR